MMKAIAQTLFFAVVLTLFSSCAEQVISIAKVDKPATTADYALVVQVLSGYSYSEVVNAAHSAGIPSQTEIIDRNPALFSITMLRFRYQQMQLKDIAKVQQRISRCKGIISASITNE